MFQKHGIYKTCIICVQLLSFSNIGPTTLANALHLMVRIKDPQYDLVAKLADRACECLKEASAPILVSLLGSMASLKLNHNLAKVGTKRQ